MRYVLVPHPVGKYEDDFHRHDELFNKNYCLSARLKGQEITRPIPNPLTGEIMADVGEVISFKKAIEIENAGVCTAYVKVDEKEVKDITLAKEYTNKEKD